MEKRNFFLSHASEDKEKIVRPVGSALVSLGNTVWIDEAELTVGDSLIEEIQNALINTDFVVVFISKAFINKGWPLEELRAMLNIQISTRTKRILPVVIDLSHKELEDILPLIAEKIYLRWDNSPEEIARHLVAAYEKSIKNQEPSTVKEENYELSAQNYYEYIKIYKQNLIAEINNNLVLELYDKPYYEDICITPFVFSSDSLDKARKVVEINKVLTSSRVAIVGEPGSGKTTALRKLALDLLRQSPTEILPVYISLASFSTDYKQRKVDDFQDYLDYEVSLFGCPNIDLFEKAKIETIILLDGWDEIGEEDARNNIRQYISGLKKRFIITSRPEAQRTLPFTDRYEMHPLSKHRIREFIRLRIKNDEIVENVFRWLSSDPRLMKLAENPLNLSIMTIVFSEVGDIGSLNKAKLYERAFECIIRQHNREHPYEGYLTEQKDQTLQIELILQHIAYNTVTSGEGRFFSLRELNKAAESVLGVVPPGLSKLLSGRLGIIRDRRSGRMEFFHLWYQEFLTARYIIESDEDTIGQLNNKKLASVLPYVVGLLPGTHLTFNLLKEIVVHDPFNFCRAIAEGYFSDDQIEELIKRVISFGGLQQPKIPIRIELSQAISQVGIRGIPSLINIVKDEELNDYARRAALEALSILQIQKEEFETVLLAILETSSLGLLWHVLEHVGKNKVKKALDKLLEYKNYPNPIVVGDAIWAINEIHEQKVEELPQNEVELLIQCLSSDDLHLQGHALRTLGRLRIASAIPKLKEHLLNKYSGYRWIVPEAAALLGGAESIDILDNAIDDHDPKVIAAALKGLSEYDNEVPEYILNKIKLHFEDMTWIQFLEQPLGIVARSTFEKLVSKSKSQDIARIFVSRHTKTLWNLENRLQGKKDLPLSEEGRQEALGNVKNISTLSINRIVTSNSKRAYETAQIYAEKLIVPLHIHPGLRELDHGRWEGVGIADLLKDKNSNYKKWIDNPTSISIPDSVESITTAQQRILEAIRNIALRYNGENVLIITHKHIRALLKCGLYGHGLEDFKNQIEESIEPQEIEREKLLRLCGIDWGID